MSDIDPCDILARHQHHRGQWGDGACASRFGGPEHCLAYLLASAVVEAEVKIERVEALLGGPVKLIDGPTPDGQQRHVYVLEAAVRAALGPTTRWYERL